MCRGSSRGLERSPTGGVYGHSCFELSLNGNSVQGRSQYQRIWRLAHHDNVNQTVRIHYEYLGYNLTPPVRTEPPRLLIIPIQDASPPYHY